MGNPGMQGLGTWGSRSWVPRLAMDNPGMQGFGTWAVGRRYLGRKKTILECKAEVPGALGLVYLAWQWAILECLDTWGAWGLGT